MKARSGDYSEASKLRRYKDVGWRSGNIVFPYEEQPLHETWLAPLDAVTRVVTGNPRFPFYDPADFMIMNQVLRRGRPTLVLYKHYYTRRYLNLGEAGHAYRHIPPKDIYTSTHHGRYVPHRDLCTAMDHLQLWYLPWMKDGLEHDRRGLDFEEAWQLDPRLADEAA
jgi:hypothetical protein